MIDAAPSMLPQIGLAGALIGGLLSIISPCSALLLPSFFAYAFTSKTQLLLRTAVFYVGLAIVLIPIGAGVGAVGSLLTKYRTTVTMTGGLIIMLLGIIIIFGGGFALPGAGNRVGRLRIGSRGSVFALGTLYGLAGFCAGPLLGGVLTVAAAGGSASYGGLLMGIYAFGMAVPLFVLALLWDKFRLGERQWLRGRPIQIGPIRTHTTSLISGLLFVAIGTLFVATSGTATLGGFIGSDTEFRMQSWLSSATGTITDIGFLFVVALVVLFILLIRVRMKRHRNTQPPAERESLEHSTPQSGITDTQPTRP